VEPCVSLVKANMVYEHKAMMMMMSTTRQYTSYNDEIVLYYNSQLIVLDKFGSEQISKSALSNYILYLQSFDWCL